MYTPEGGKLRLAEAIFDSYRFLVRCPNCLGNSTKPGFIKDEGGKSSKDGLRRRQWACQMSNGRRVRQVCPRVTCSDYILLAQRQLSPASFKRVVGKICHDSTLDRDQRQAIRCYLSETEPPLGSISSSIPSPSPPSTLTLPASTIASSDAPAASSSLTGTLSSPIAGPTPIRTKRKAEGEPPDTPSKAVPPSLRLRSEVRLVKQRLRSALDLLSPLPELADTWDEIIGGPSSPPTSGLVQTPTVSEVTGLALPSSQASIFNPRAADSDGVCSLVNDFQRADGPGKSAIRRQAREEGIYDQFFTRMMMQQKNRAETNLELERSDRR